MGAITKLATGRRSRWIVIAAWLVLALATAPLQPELGALAADESDAFRSASAESTRAADRLEARFADGADSSTVIAYTRAGGLTGEDTERIRAEAASLCDSRAIPSLARVITPFGLACGSLDESIAPASPVVGPVSTDNTTALVTVQSRDDATDAVVRDVAAVRSLVPDPGADGLRAYVTGETAFAADQSASFEGIDETLLAITAALILILLLAVYRSPVAAVVPLACVSLAYLVAAGAVYGLARAGAFDVTGQATAILIVLMFGAGTDYCLLTIARGREELRRARDPHAGLRTAAARSAPTIAGAGGIVVAAMLVLTLADYRATASMGPVLAVGAAITVAASLTLLPALLSVLGRRAFWPAVPERGGERGTAVWARIGALVRDRPWPTIAVVTALLLAGCAAALDGRGPLSFADSFRDPPESVEGQELIAAKYPPGVLGPAEAIVASARAGTLVEAVDRASGVLGAQATSLSRDGSLTRVEITLDGDPFSEAVVDRVPELRAAVHRAAQGGEALLGGPSAEQFDAREALRADAALIVPLTLLVVLLIVGALVRAVVAPLYLVATVVLSYGFALGASSLFFTHVLGQPDSDPALPIFTFVFLVALGVDYNVFLISRIREERAQLDDRAAVVSGLERSGGVITSAGLILAGTFCTLIALDVVGLAQVGFTVAFGLLVDTFVVRCFLVPSIAVVLGRRSWWPGRAVRTPAARAAACVALALLVLGMREAPDARAERFTVDTLADAGPGTLRAALEAAEELPGADEVRIAAEGTIALEMQLPDLHTELSLHGPGADRLTVTRGDAAGPFRLLTVGPRGTVSATGVTFAGGRYEERSAPLGGAVLNEGRLTLDGVVVRDSTVRGRLAMTGGGGIANSGTLSVLRSVVRDNRAESSEAGAAGGGIYNTGGLLVEESTIAGNATSQAWPGAVGAGVEHAAGIGTVRHSTVSGNAGVGIHNAFADLWVETSTVAANRGAVSAIGGATHIRNSTLTGPGGPNLAGLRVDIPSALTIGGTILAEAGEGQPDCVTTSQVEAVSLGHNLADDDSCGYLTAAGDQRSVDAALLPLADNGGPTRTRAFPPGAPAHDAGAAGAPARDQRGLPRPFGPRPDVGALELASPHPGGVEAGAPPAPPPPAATPPPPPPQAGAAPAPRARLRRLRVRRQADGSARLRLRVPLAGRLVLGGHGVRRVTRRALGPGRVTLRLRARGRAERRLRRRGHARVRATLRYLPRSGAPQARRLSVRLVRAR